jgi:hypothetical protein
MRNHYDHIGDAISSDIYAVALAFATRIRDQRYAEIRFRRQLELMFLQADGSLPRLT